MVTTTPRPPPQRDRITGAGADDFEEDVLLDDQAFLAVGFAGDGADVGGGMHWRMEMPRSRITRRTVGWTASPETVAFLGRRCQRPSRPPCRR